MIQDIPLPATDDPVDAPFWQGTLRSTLLMQRCAECHAMRFPPRPMCPHCQSTACDWQEVSGRGRIWSFTAPQSPLLPAFEALRPYVTALVELEEDVRLRVVGPVLTGADGDIQGVEISQVHIGQPVTVAFKQFAEDVAMPCWVPQTVAYQGNDDAD